MAVEKTYALIVDPLTITSAQIGVLLNAFAYVIKEPVYLNLPDVVKHLFHENTVSESEGPPTGEVAA